MAMKFYHLFLTFSFRILVQIFSSSVIIAEGASRFANTISGLKRHNPFKEPK